MGRVLVAALASALLVTAPAAAQEEEAPAPVLVPAPVAFTCPADIPADARCLVVADPDGLPADAYPVECPPALVAEFLTTALRASCWVVPKQPDTPPWMPAGTTCTDLPSEGAVAVTAFAVRRPGEEWKDGLPFACLQLWTMFDSGTTPFDPWIGDILALRLFSRTGANELARELPVGTELSVEFESSGPDIVEAAGTMRDPVARFSGSTAVVQGRSTAQRFGRSDRDSDRIDCSDVYTFDSLFAVDITLAAANPALAARYPYRGSFFMSNAQVLSSPVVSDDKQSVMLELSGCGDGKPETDDGFFQGFIPSDALEKMGLPEELVEAVPQAAVDELLALADNGKSAPDAKFKPAKGKDLKLDPAPGVSIPLRSTEEGVVIDYSLSFSRHRLRTSADRADVRTAKRCRARRGRLRVAGKGKRARLVCRPRTRR